MPQHAWATFFRPQSGSATPDSFRYVFSALSGAALSFSYTGFYLSIYSWVCVGILLIVLFGARSKVAFACGFLHSMFFVITCCPWLATVLAVHGGLSKAGGWGIVILIGCVFGALTGAFAWCVNRLARQSVLLACVGAPFLWVTFEFFRARMPEISFPWGLLGYPASANLALLQLTTITGIYGLSFLVASVNALLAWCDAASSVAPSRRLAILGASIAPIFIAIFAGPRFVPQAVPNHYARVVQGNFPEVMEDPATWFRNHAADLAEIENLSLAPAAREPDLLIWPEAPTPFSFEDAQFTKIASSIATHFRHPFLTGSIEWRQMPSASNPQARHILVPYNSAILLDANGQHLFTYDKVHLVPFGEYEPFPLIHRVAPAFPTKSAASAKARNIRSAIFPAIPRLVCSSATKPFFPTKCAASPPTARTSSSTSPTTVGSAAPPLPSSTCAWPESAPSKIAAGSCASPTTASPFPSIPMAASSAPLPPDVRAAVDLPYDFRTEETLYTRAGDWFAWLCVLVSVILLSLTFRKGNTSREELLIPVGISPPPSSLARNSAVSGGSEQD